MEQPSRNLLCKFACTFHGHNESMSSCQLCVQARGKSGPLFHFDVHEDVRLVNDASREKDESHAGKVVERHWYNRWAPAFMSHGARVAGCCTSTEDSAECSTHSKVQPALAPFLWQASKARETTVLRSINNARLGPLRTGTSTSFRRRGGSSSMQPQCMTRIPFTAAK